MSNNFKSRKINVLGRRHMNLTNENIENVWNVNVSNIYTHKNQSYLSDLEQLERYKKSMYNGTVRMNRDLYEGIQQRLKLESNKALELFNKPKKASRRSSKRRYRKTRRNGIN